MDVKSTHDDLLPQVIRLSHGQRFAPNKVVREQCFLLPSDDEYLEVPQSQEVSVGTVVTLRCVHKFGWSYTWRSNRRYITRTDSKVQSHIS